jgi:hypothetical protein
MGTTIITINIKGGLIKTHIEFIKKGCFLQLKKLFMKAKKNYNLFFFDWTIEVSANTKLKTILVFDALVKLHFMSKDTIHSFSHHMLQRFTTTTVAFDVIGVCGEIDNKFELLVVEKIIQTTFKL